MPSFRASSPKKTLLYNWISLFVSEKLFFLCRNNRNLSPLVGLYELFNEDSLARQRKKNKTEHRRRREFFRVITGPWKLLTQEGILPLFEANGAHLSMPGEDEGFIRELGKAAKGFHQRRITTSREIRPADGTSEQCIP